MEGNMIKGIITLAKEEARKEAMAKKQRFCPTPACLQVYR
jgi:hypothetical protein